MKRKPFFELFHIPHVPYPFSRFIVIKIFVSLFTHFKSRFYLFLYTQFQILFVPKNTKSSQTQIFQHLHRNFNLIFIKTVHLKCKKATPPTRFVSQINRNPFNQMRLSRLQFSSTMHVLHKTQRIQMPFRFQVHSQTFSSILLREHIVIPSLKCI